MICCVALLYRITFTVGSVLQMYCILFNENLYPVFPVQAHAYVDVGPGGLC